MHMDTTRSIPRNEELIAQFVHMECDIQSTAASIEAIEPESLAGSLMHSREALLSVRDACISGAITAAALESWAIEIERLSVFYIVYPEEHEQRMRGVIFQLANQSGEDTLHSDSCRALRDSLR